MTEQKYRITGMSCAACSASVERVTRKLEGVSESEVNLTTETMRIVYDENVVGEEQIVAKVNKAGFGCEKIEEESLALVDEVSGVAASKRQEKQKKDQEETQKLLRVKRQKLIVTMVFAVLLLYIPFLDIVESIIFLQQSKILKETECDITSGSCEKITCSPSSRSVTVKLIL